MTMAMVMTMTVMVAVVTVAITAHGSREQVHCRSNEWRAVESRHRRGCCMRA